ncbi:hypothetical protein GE09DRAFT_1226106 [Coniochaeta sp. 2T2.1]|nr:hypothetical protein GE09DRAFT_1226106 [Coniochaeta sp. 2T2.1]
MWKALRWFYSHRYFTRVWVIQELNVNLRRTLRCGHRTIGWICVQLVAGYILMDTSFSRDFGFSDAYYVGDRIHRSVVTAFWTLTLTPIVYDMNAKYDIQNGNKKDSDACGVKQPSTSSVDAVNGLTSSPRPGLRRGYTAADLADANSQTHDSGGTYATAEFFVESRADVFAPKRGDMGIVWRGGWVEVTRP